MRTAVLGPSLTFETAACGGAKRKGMKPTFLEAIGSIPLPRQTQAPPLRGRM